MSRNNLLFIIIPLFLLSTIIYSQDSAEFHRFSSGNDSIIFSELSFHCFNLIKEKKVDEFYNLLSPVAKVITTRHNIEYVVNELSSYFGNIISLNSIEIKQIPYEDIIIHETISDIDTDKERVIFTLDMIRNENDQLCINGFNAWVVPRRPISLFSFKYASTWHYAIFITFFLILSIQIICVILFIRFKPKRKWIYLIGCFLGAPIGMKVNWSSLVYVISLGGYIPAASWRLAKSGDGSYVVYLFFPLGLLLLIDLIIYRKRQQRKKDVPEE